MELNRPGRDSARPRPHMNEAFKSQGYFSYPVWGGLKRLLLSTHSAVYQNHLLTELNLSAKEALILTHTHGWPCHTSGMKRKAAQASNTLVSVHRARLRLDSLLNAKRGGFDFAAFCGLNFNPKRSESTLSVFQLPRSQGSSFIATCQPIIWSRFGPGAYFLFEAGESMMSHLHKQVHMCNICISIYAYIYICGICTHDGNVHNCTTYCSSYYYSCSCSC